MKIFTDKEMKNEVDTLDLIRTTVTANYSGWSGTVTPTEYSVPISSTHSLMIYKMLHS